MRGGTFASSWRHDEEERSYRSIALLLYGNGTEWNGGGLSVAQPAFDVWGVIYDAAEHDADTSACPEVE